MGRNIDLDEPTILPTPEDWDKLSKDFKHRFLIRRGYLCFEGFKIETPALNPDEFGWIGVDKEDMLNSICSGSINFYYKLNSEVLFELEEIFEEELEEYIEEEGINKLSDDNKIFHIKKYFLN